jgi:S1-C subfamily serine protease
MVKYLPLVAVFAFTTNTSPLAGSTIPDIVAKTKPAVALIKTWDNKGDLLASATGFLISEDGRLVTNQHVIKDAARVTVELPNGGTFNCEGLLAKPIGVDLAILKVRGTGLPKVEMGSSSALAEGQKVIVIGNPEGLQWTASDGIIAALRTDQKLVQITAPISPGSSGSPVLDENGKVIGIATAFWKEGQNLNFAIPIEHVIEAAAALKPDAKPIAFVAASERQAVTPNPTPSLQPSPTPSEVSTEVSEAQILVAEGQSSSAAKSLQEHLQNHPSDAAAWATYSDALDAMSLIEQSVTALSQSLSIDPLNRWRWVTYAYRLGQLYSTVRSPELLVRIQKASETALSLGDDQKLTWDLRIFAVRVRGDQTEATTLTAQENDLIQRGELIDFADGYYGRFSKWRVFR